MIAMIFQGKDIGKTIGERSIQGNAAGGPLTFLHQRKMRVEDAES